ncbi:MAG: hypothetical protein ACLQC0_02385 [Thermoplasmata archaeon]
MAQQPQGRFRHFLSTPPGRIILILLAVGAVFATYAYVSVIIAIPAVLLFGLALPIWAGTKRPRVLAIIGLVIVLAVAPIATVVFTQEILTPVGLSSSPNNVPLSNGNEVMQNATVSPYTGTSSTNFTWTVTVFPANVPQNNRTPYELFLYISTCPGATGNSSPYCTQPYPLTVLPNPTPLPDANQTPVNGTAPYIVTFHYQIGTNGIWAWQMGIYSRNNTTGVPYFQTLSGDPTYNGIEGPVIGGFGVIYSDLLLTIYFQDLLFLGAPFYFVLLVYMLFKNRERRKKEAQQRAPGPVPPVTVLGGTTPAPPAKGTPLPSSNTLPGPAAGPPANAASATQELNCPKCNAVVYVGEQTCWKCGATLPASSGGPAKTN